MSGDKCRNCGSNEIETDPARGDAVCTACGFVLEDQLIVSETTFEETSSGNMVVLGQFVANDSTGGPTGFGGGTAGFRVNGKESREITIQNARNGITHLCQQLRLNNRYVETSVNFYKMALARNLTRGRKHAHNHAACVYITCRTEGTAHMLIDISDVLHIDVHELGRTYLKFTQALCINIPSMDPCLYIMRFANKLEFGDKTHQVSTTALRLVQRMKRDSIHSGRRPSGLCGAALLIAARLHEFNRTPGDIIKIVKVHESTLRKRLIEFGDTPSSALTLDEFMTVDLEEEQDPPAFKAARKKDRERLQKLENIDSEFDELQSEIDRQLDEQHKTMRKRSANSTCDYSYNELIDQEEAESARFIEENTVDAISNCLDNPSAKEASAYYLKAKSASRPIQAIELGPDIDSMGLPTSIDDSNLKSNRDHNNHNKFDNGTGEIDITDLDDDELDAYILSEHEASRKTNLWNTINASYLEQQKEKEEKRLKEKEEGKPEKKKRRTGTKKKNQTPANSAGEAIEKMLQEKRISSKINYEVLKSLNVNTTKNNSPGKIQKSIDKVNDSNQLSESFNFKSTHRAENKNETNVSLQNNQTKIEKNIPSAKLKTLHSEESKRNKQYSLIEENKGSTDGLVPEENKHDNEEEEYEEENDYDEEDHDEIGEMSLSQMLKRHTQEENYGYDDYGDDDY
ncbi:transcription factor IIIB 90 kDa subunit [Chelonus insularis]|uniref:transcription factor IIIB 90 kDa subunit n=1 Tax=Chelonus insularis TaxID=460826 RepID=UPI00158E6B79|nr:transcription factor IIIB 90 kDa subunit [Chelonus insularis]XP_034950052.1 transcription factor IIIB 90 kDa subunit [Chelonus insularis]